MRAEAERRATAHPLSLAAVSTWSPDRRAHGDRRLPLVHRLGTRHLHRPARSVPGHGPARRRARRSSAHGRRRSREGMLPNRFPDAATPPEYNSVDASLWFVVAAHELLARARRRRWSRRRSARALAAAVAAIVDGYAAGTRYGIGADDDGLLAAGAPGVQLTWMDAKVGDWVVTPRIGKPVEIQALWLNALGSRQPRWAERWREPARARARRPSPRASGTRRAAACYDVVDVDHVAGTVDAALRPNQIFAVGGLPLALLDGAARAAVVDARRGAAAGRRSGCARSRRTTRLRGRTTGATREPRRRLPPGHGLAVAARPFVEAWVACAATPPRPSARRASAFSRRCCAHSSDAGLGHVSEIADGDPPHTPARLSVPGLVARRIPTPARNARYRGQLRRRTMPDQPSAGTPASSRCGATRSARCARA